MPVVETTAIISAAASASLAITAGASLASTSVQGLSQGNGIRNCVVEISKLMPTDTLTFHTGQTRKSCTLIPLIGVSFNVI